MLWKFAALAANKETPQYSGLGGWASVHSFNQYLLSAYCVFSIVQGTGETAIIKETTPHPCLYGEK
jgi:hypothetical protein